MTVGPLNVTRILRLSCREFENWSKWQAYRHYGMPLWSESWL